MIAQYGEWIRPDRHLLSNAATAQPADAAKAVSQIRSRGHQSRWDNHQACCGSPVHPNRQNNSCNNDPGRLCNKEQRMHNRRMPRSQAWQGFAPKEDCCCCRLERERGCGERGKERSTSVPMLQMLYSHAHKPPHSGATALLQLPLQGKCPAHAKCEATCDAKCAWDTKCEAHPREDMGSSDSATYGHNLHVSAPIGAAAGAAAHITIGRNPRSGVSASNSHPVRPGYASRRPLGTWCTPLHTDQRHTAPQGHRIHVLAHHPRV